MTIEEAIETIEYAAAFNSDKSPLTDALKMATFALRESRKFKETEIELSEAKKTITELLWMCDDIQSCKYCEFGILDETKNELHTKCNLLPDMPCRPKWRGVEQ